MIEIMRQRFERLLTSLRQPREWVNFRRKRFWIVAIFLAYVLFGFFIAPGILRREIVAQIQANLNRPAALDEVRLNPLAFSVELRGLRITETDGAALAGFDRLYIRFGLDSVWRWAWCFADFRLEGLKSSFVRYSAADTNFGRLMPPAETSAPKPAPEAKSGLPRLILHRVTIQNAAAHFADHVPATEFETLIGPVDVELKEVSTLPNAQGEQRVSVETEGGAKLEWTGKFGLDPIESSGHVSARGSYGPVIVRYFEDVLGFSEPTGRSAADLDYQLRTGTDGALSLAVDHLDFTLSDLALRQKKADHPFLVLPQLHLAGGHFNWPERRVGADSLSIEGLNIAAVREADGQMNLVKMLGQPGAAPSDHPAAAEANAKGDAWVATLGKFEIKHAGARLDDHSLHEPSTIEIRELALEIGNLTSEPGARFPVSFAMTVGSGGSLTMKGQVAAIPKVTVDAALVLSDLRIAAAQPYLHEAARLKIGDGAISFETQIKVDGPDAITASGRGDVHALKLDDEVEKSPVIAFDRVGIDYFKYEKAANRVQISQIAIQAPYLRLAVEKDLSTNFSHLAIAKGGDKANPAKRQADGPKSARAEKPQPRAARAEKPISISVGKVSVAKGSADYKDLSLPLPFAAHITELHGASADLATDSKAPVRLSLEGQVGTYGEAKIEGALTPFDPPLNSKIAVNFRNVDFPDLSPYTVKFAGRRIAKGRLDVSLNYVLKTGNMKGQNRIVIRDLQLGEKVEVPGALDLPLDLAVALLTDSDGKIDVDVPVSGDLGNPQFDIGSVIKDEIAKILTRIITAPFEALASLFGGGDAPLDHIDFEPGSAVLSPPEKEKILHLAKALEQRPRLALAIPGTIDPDADRAALQRQALEAEMVKALGDRLTLDRQRDFLESQYQDKVAKDGLEPLQQQNSHAPEGQPNQRPVLDEAAYVTALRRAVAKAEPVGDANLEGLAQARSNAVAESLKQAPGVDPKRVTQRASTQTKADSTGAIPLKLDAASAGS